MKYLPLSFPILEKEASLPKSHLGGLEGGLDVHKEILELYIRLPGHHWNITPIKDTTLECRLGIYLRY